ncbi:MAG: hypothetical protein JWQ96_3326 [Segetibacter sp.]|nr:hypothetical protein [Segetibacter sp.]
MKPEGLVKQEHILEAAIKRFSHFGISKTTLTEIAEDLAISKPSLFYYFTDKNGLIAEVAKKIINEFLEKFENKLQSSSSVEAGLLSLVEVKRNHFKKYFLLAIQADGVDQLKVSNNLSEVYGEARKKTISLMSCLFKKGIEQGELKPMEVERTSVLIIDVLSSLDGCMKDKRFIPNINDFDAFFNKQEEVLKMLLNGLKSNTWKN